MRWYAYDIWLCCYLYCGCDGELLSMEILRNCSSGDADFMRNELSITLKNLNKTSLDSFIHEPEEQLRKEFPFIIDDSNSPSQPQQR